MGEKAPEISSLSFEEALKELEALSQRLSQGGLTEGAPPVNGRRLCVISWLLRRRWCPAGHTATAVLPAVFRSS